MKITAILEKQVDQWISEHQKQLAEEICRLIRYPSILEEPSPGAPFGRSCREVLESYLEIGKSHDLAVQNH